MKNISEIIEIEIDQLILEKININYFEYKTSYTWKPIMEHLNPKLLEITVDKEIISYLNDNYGLKYIRVKLINKFTNGFLMNILGFNNNNKIMLLPDRSNPIIFLTIEDNFYTFR